METAIHAEDLQTLQDALRGLLADLPLDFQCRSQAGALMVVGQHSADVGLPRDLLRTLERRIQTLQLRFVQQARLYLRIAGEPRPYAQRFFLIQPPPPPPPRVVAPSLAASAVPPSDEIPKLAALPTPSPVASLEAPWLVSDTELDALLHELVGAEALDQFLQPLENEGLQPWAEPVGDIDFGLSLETDIDFGLDLSDADATGFLDGFDPPPVERPRASSTQRFVESALDFLAQPFPQLFAQNSPTVALVKPPVGLPELASGHPLSDSAQPADRMPAGVLESPPPAWVDPASADQSTPLSAAISGAIAPPIPKSTTELLPELLPESISVALPGTTSETVAESATIFSNMFSGTVADIPPDEFSQTFSDSEHFLESEAFLDSEHFSDALSEPFMGRDAESWTEIGGALVSVEENSSPGSDLFSQAFPADLLAEMPLDQSTEPAALTGQRGIERRVLLTGGAIALGVASGVYGLSRPCVVGSCPELELAQTSQSEAIRGAETAVDAAALQASGQPLYAAIATLETIPLWSGYAREARQLQQTYLTQAETLDHLRAIAELGTTAEQKSDAAPIPMESWQEVLDLWKTAINRLDAIAPSNPYYRTAQRLRQRYQGQQQDHTRQLEAETTAQTSLNMAKQGIEMATARQQIAETAAQWQLVSITWQMVMLRLNEVPEGSYAAIEATQLLQSYEPQLTASLAQQEKEATAADLLTQATTFAADAQQAAQQANWQGAIVAWTNAIRHTEQIPANTTQASRATELARTYATAVSQAQAKLENNTAISLEIDRVCNQEFRKCRLMGIGSDIRVQLSPAYMAAIAQARDSGNRDLQALVAEHQLNLRKSLQDLAARFQLSIAVFDDTETLLDRHDPQVPVS